MGVDLFQFQYLTWPILFAGNLVRFQAQADGFADKLNLLYYGNVVREFMLILSQHK